jgi:hypothetical protein
VDTHCVPAPGLSSRLFSYMPSHLPRSCGQEGRKPEACSTPPLHPCSRDGEKEGDQPGLVRTATLWVGGSRQQQSSLYLTDIFL